MKTTLINCGVPTSKVNDGARVPQGCLYLLAAAREAGYRIDFRDYQVVRLEDPLDDEYFLDFITDDSDVVAISCMSNLLPLVVESTRKFKEQNPEKTVLLGGIGPSGVADELMSAFPHIDIIAKGEGEETLVDLLNAFETKSSLANVDGILFRKGNGGFQATQPRIRKKRLDEFARPAYDLVDMQRYETVGIQTARGCPFPCKFCDVSAYWGRRATYRSIDPVMDEMEILEKEYGFELGPVNTTESYRR